MAFSTDTEILLREQLVRALGWEGAHMSLESAVKKFPFEWVGRKAEGVPYTAWQLLEHIRLTQRDILDFCRNPNYHEPRWPDDYWPGETAPPGEAEWVRSVELFKIDLDAFADLIANPALDLFAKIPHGDGQTYLREAILIIDHTAYHVGQLIVLWRLLGGS